MASINDAAVDCGDVYSRFRKDFRENNGVNPAEMPLDRAKAVNGDVGDLLPNPKDQGTAMVEKQTKL